MPRFRSLRVLAHAFTVLFTVVGLSGTVLAQEQAGDRVYRFTVQGITHRVAAKPIQYALMEHPSATSCDFIEECACFKLGCSTALDYVTLRDLLAANGQVLVGDVDCSDGTVLRPPTDTEER